MSFKYGAVHYQDETMDAGGPPLPDTINLNFFPAKLWRLVNNPAVEAIFWDSQGEAVVIDQHLFERQILSPGTINLDARDTFKTTNFSSFVRQLNLYGFRKVELEDKDNDPIRGSGAYHQFSNPNFKRNHPQLVASLRRLTADIKAKAMTVYTGTPVPPQHPRRDHGVALSLAASAADKGIPGSLSHHYAGIASSSDAVHFQQGFLASAHRESFATFTPPSAQHQPHYSLPVFQCSQPVPLAAHLTGFGLQMGLFSPYSFYQAGYSVNMMCGRDHSHDPQHKGYQEVKKGDINVDTIFQIADEVLPSPPSSCAVAVVTPENPRPVVVPSSVTCTLCDNPTSAMQANAMHAGAESHFADMATYKHQEESVLSLSEPVLEDEIIEVMIDDAEDTEFIDGEFSNTVVQC